MKTAGGVVLILTGFVWILQGFDVAFAPESFMTDDRQWTIWGGLAIIIGGVLIWWDRTKK